MTVSSVIAPPQGTHPLRAAVWMLGAVFGFSSMAIAGRQLAGELDTFEIMAYRSMIGLVTILIAARVGGTFHTIHARHLNLHFARNLCHFAGQNLWLFALTVIPLAQLFAFEFTSPLIVALLAPVFLAERLTKLRIATALIGFAGILIVTRPFDGAGFSPGLIAALLCAFGFAGSILFTKKLTMTGHVTVTCILFWLSVMQLGFGLLCAGYDGDMVIPTLGQAGWVMVIGLAGLGAHFCLTTALSLAPAAVVTPVDFLRLPLIAVLGWQFYNEPLEWPVLVGAAIIFGANYSNIVSETRARRRALAG